jgi:hypothetical protein
MTRLLAFVLFVCSTAATQATPPAAEPNLILNALVANSIIRADDFNKNNKLTEKKVNNNGLIIQANTNLITGNALEISLTEKKVNNNGLIAKSNTNLINSNALEISGLTTKVNSCLVLPSGCTAGQSITFDGSALVCADILPTCLAYQTIIYVDGAWVCSSG